MATESIFAQVTIDTEWGIEALCDAYDRFMEGEGKWEPKPEEKRPPRFEYFDRVLAKIHAEEAEELRAAP